MTKKHSRGWKVLFVYFIAVAMPLSDLEKKKLFSLCDQQTILPVLALLSLLWACPSQFKSHQWQLGVSQAPLYNHMASAALRINRMSLFASKYLQHTHIYTHTHTYIYINIASLTSNASRHCNNENLECVFLNLWCGHVQYWFCFPIRHWHT